jgi:3-oxoacyl-(acyl-carrier-protein) synthase
MTDEIANDGVVVTGMGLVTPIGVTVQTFWSSLLEGRCGIGPVEGVEGEHLGLSVAAQIKDYDPRTPLKAWQRDKTILHSDRYSWLAAAAAEQQGRYQQHCQHKSGIFPLRCYVGLMVDFVVQQDQE